MVQRALITGITGQDGFYLSNYLESKGYKVYGLKRWSSQSNQNIDLNENVNILEGDLSDQNSIDRALKTAEPQEVYNLAAISSVSPSYNQPIQVGKVNGLGVTRILESIRKNFPEARFFQASTSEIFEESGGEAQSMDSGFEPVNPYGASKLYGHNITKIYREVHDIYACNGVMFNHESPRRPPSFVTRKITLGAARINEGLQDELRLGNLDAERDWGHARDYVKAMHLMLQQENPDDYVVGSGKKHSVRDFVEAAFNHLDLDWKNYVKVDEEFYRPIEVPSSKADITKARKRLDWKPETPFDKLVKEMVESDLEKVRENGING